MEELNLEKIILGNTTEGRPHNAYAVSLTGLIPGLETGRQKQNGKRPQRNRGGQKNYTDIIVSTSDDGSIVEKVRFDKYGNRIAEITEVLPKGTSMPAGDYFEYADQKHGRQKDTDREIEEVFYQDTTGRTRH